MEQLDRELLSMIQSGFPLVSRPYHEVGLKLGITEADVILRLANLKDQGFVRRIGAVIESRALGYVSTLCALKAPAEKLAEVERIVNAFAGVTHNYIREHELNIWFTFMASSPDELAKGIKEIAEKTGLPVNSMPSRKTYKIKLEFSIP